MMPFDIVDRYSEYKLFFIAYREYESYNRFNMLYTSKMNILLGQGILYLNNT